MERIAQVVALLTAIGAWVALVGGARLWARLHHADIASAQTLAVLPHQLLVVDGFQTLVAPLLIGGTAALLIFSSWSELEEGREGIADECTDEIMRRTRAADKRLQARTGILPLTSATGDDFGWEKYVEPGGAAKGTRRQRGMLSPRMQSSRHRRTLQTAPKVRIPAPVFLLRSLIKRHGNVPVVVGATLVALVLAILALTILQVNWSWPAWSLLFGTVLAIVAAIFPPDRPSRARRPGWPKTLFLTLAVVAPLVGLFVAAFVRIEFRYLMAIALVTLLVVWLTLGALVRATRRRTALTVLAAFAVWAGTVAFLRDLGARHPKFEAAVVMRKHSPAECGFYLGGAGGDVYIASYRTPRTVTRIAKDDVAALSFSAAVPVTGHPPRGIFPSVTSCIGTGENHAPPARSAELSLYALDEVVSSDGTIDFPVGGGGAETYKLRFSVRFVSPTTLSPATITLPSQVVRTAAGTQRDVHVRIAAESARAALTRGYPLLVMVMVDGYTDSSASAATYAVCVAPRSLLSRQHERGEMTNRAPRQTSTGVSWLLPKHVAGTAPTC